MQLIYRTARYALPALFLGYGVFANYHLLVGGKLVVDPTERPLSGGVTAQIDAIYKQDLPLRSAAVGLVGAMRYRLIGEGRDGVLAADNGWLFTAEEARVMTEDMSVVVGRVTEIQRQLAEMGTTLVIVPLPAKADIEDAHAGRPEISQAQAERHQAFLAALKASGIATIDIRPALVTAADGGDAFFATDTHWTVGGAGAAARAIAVDLRTQGLAPEPLAFSAARETEAAFAGDLVSFVTTPDLAPIIGLHAERVTPIRATALEPVSFDATDLFGGSSAGGIALVGTSYSANPRWSFADSLMLELGADVINHAQEGRGPVKPVYEMLADPAFAEAPPSLVIWEFPVRFLADRTIWDRTETDHGA